MDKFGQIKNISWKITGGQRVKNKLVLIGIFMK